MSDDRRIRATPAVLLRIGAGVLLLGLVLSRVDASRLSIRWDARTLAGFAGTVALLALCQLLSALRWRLVLGDAATSFAYLVRVYLVGVFFSLFLPTSVGGDAVRAVAISRASPRPAWAVSSVVFERFLGMVALVGLLLTGSLAAPSVFRTVVGRAALRWAPSAPQLAAVAAALLVGGAGTAWVARRSPLAARVLREGSALWAGFWTRPGAFLAALGVSVLVQVTYALAWYRLGASLGLGVPAVEFLVFVPFVSLAAMLPVTLSGIGVREGAWALLLAPYGIAAADAVAYSLLYFLAFVAVGIAGGIVFAAMGIDLRPAAAPAPSPATSSITLVRTEESLSQL